MHIVRLLRLHAALYDVCGIPVPMEAEKGTPKLRRTLAEYGTSTLRRTQLRYFAEVTSEASPN